MIPLARAPARDPNRPRRGRKPGRSRDLTSTPKKRKLEEIQQQKTDKIMAASARKRGRGARKGTLLCVSTSSSAGRSGSNVRGRERGRARVTSPETTSSDSDSSQSESAMEDVLGWESKSDSEPSSNSVKIGAKISPRLFSFVIVKVAKKKEVKYYIGKVIDFPEEVEFK